MGKPTVPVIGGRLLQRGLAFSFAIALSNCDISGTVTPKGDGTMDDVTMTPAQKKWYKKQRSIGVQLEKEVYERFTEICKEKSMSKNGVVRKLIRDFVADPKPVEETELRRKAFMSIRVDAATADKLDKARQELGVSKSAIVRKLVGEWVDVVLQSKMEGFSR